MNDERLTQFSFHQNRKKIKKLDDSLQHKNMLQKGNLPSSTMFFHRASIIW